MSAPALPIDAVAAKAATIARMERMGALDPNCPGCREFYEASDPAAHFAPAHKASFMCRSGGRAHCTCSACF